MNLVMSWSTAAITRTAQSATKVTRYPTIGILKSLTGGARRTGAEILLKDIADTRALLASMKLDKNIPVGNSDAGSYFNTKVLSAVDYGVRVGDCSWLSNL